MRLSLAALGGAGLLASAATIPTPPQLPPLPITEFKGNPFVRPLTFQEVKEGATLVNTTKHDDEQPKMSMFAAAAAAAECPNPRIRIEWDSYSPSDKSAYISAIRCLQGRPSTGRYPGSRSKYEDLVALHQKLTPNVHGNAKFLLWHRYFLWTFESLLRNECGFNRALPWFDETRYSGRFSQSNIFSGDYMGNLANVNGGCVPNGAFANVPINIGPGTTVGRPHCLQRNGNAQLTANTNKAWVDACHNTNVYPTYKDMAACSEGGPHAYGHNGIGGVMADVYASPADPVFFLHHAFVDHNFRIWQNADPARITASGVNGQDAFGNTITMNTMIYMEGLAPDIAVYDILNTKSQKMCYRYDY